MECSNQPSKKAKTEAIVSSNENKKMLAMMSSVLENRTHREIRGKAKVHNKKRH